MIEDHVVFKPNDPTIEFDTSLHFFKNKMLYFKREFSDNEFQGVHSQLILYQYDFKTHIESPVADANGHHICKDETDEMRFYNRFSTEFGSHDEGNREEEQEQHHADPIIADSFTDVMSKIYLSMIPY